MFPSLLPSCLPPDKALLTIRNAVSEVTKRDLWAGVIRINRRLTTGTSRPRSGNS